MSLLAPACTEHYFDALQQKLTAAAGSPPLDTAIYALTDTLERDDTVAGLYRKSLLYLIANALEGQSDTPILGLEKVALRAATRYAWVRTYLSGSEATDSRTHGGFDNDPTTLNHLINRVLGNKPGKIDGSNGGFASWMFEGSVPR
jgi:hypothetical protein